MPSHGRGAYRAAKSATRALNEQTEQTNADIARLMEAWQAERTRAEAAERQVAAIEALAVRYAEASRDAPQYPHVDSGRAWHWVAIDIRTALKELSA